MRQADLQALCGEFIDDASGVLGCALVDVATGLPLAFDVKPESWLTNDATAFLFAASVSCFAESAESSASVGPRPSSGGEGRLREVQLTTKFGFHFMSLVPGVEQELAVLVTDRGSSLGLGWMMMRRFVERVLALEVETPTEQPAAARATAYLPKLTPAPPSETRFKGRHASARRTVWDR